MKKIILTLTIILSALASNAQVISSDLSKINIIKVDDRILVCGYLPAEGKTDFKATLYDKKLDALGSYEKNMPITDAKATNIKSCTEIRFWFGEEESLMGIFSNFLRT